MDTVAERVLSDEQVAAFDVEYVDREKWRVFRECLDWDFPDGKFSLLDVGGGNGVFADRVLAHYPQAEATVLDNSQLLLSRNSSNTRKDVILGDAMRLEMLPCQYDVICFNWVVHHLVGDSYEQTIDTIRNTLSSAREKLTPRGRISIYDNLYDGLLIDLAPSKIIFALTSMRGAGKLMRKLGANTGGVGVCFQSTAAWFGHFSICKLRAANFHKYPPFIRGPLTRIAETAVLHLRPQRPAHFWLART